MASSESLHLHSYQHFISQIQNMLTANGNLQRMPPKHPHNRLLLPGSQDRPDKIRTVGKSALLPNVNAFPDCMQHKARRGLY